MRFLPATRLYLPVAFLNWMVKAAVKVKTDIKTEQTQTRQK